MNLTPTRLAIVATHPIQYYAPLFRLLAQEPDIELMVFYTWSQSQTGAKFDRDFGKIIEWDIPLLNGYSFEFVENSAKDPGVHHFNGIFNPGLNEKIRRWKPDFLLIVGWSFRSHLACMRYFKGEIPVLFRGDSTLLDEKPGIRKILRRIALRWVYKNVDYALFVGRNNHDYYHIHGLKEPQLHWVPQAVDNDRFADNDVYDSKANQWREDLGLSENDLVILFAGKLQDQKDPEFMLRLAKNIPDPRLKIVIVGNGNLERELKIEGSRDNRIIFIDFQNQTAMPLVYRLGDIFILPSRSETWGLAVNEAMASKRPVIVSSQCGCAPDLVEEGVTGWVFEPDKKGEIKVKELLGKLLEDRAILPTMGTNAELKIKSYAYSVAVDRLGQLFQKIKTKEDQKSSG